MSITRRIISSNYPIPPPRATSTINPKVVPVRQSPIFIPKTSPDFKITQGNENNPCKACDIDVKPSQSSCKTNNVKSGTMIDCKLIKKDKSASLKLGDCENIGPIDEPEEDYTILGMCKKKDNPKPIDASCLPKTPVKPAESKSVSPPKATIKHVESKTQVKPTGPPKEPVKTVSPPKAPVIPVESTMPSPPKEQVKSKNTPKVPVKPIESKTAYPSSAPVKSIETKHACPSKSPEKSVDTKTTCVPKAPELPVKSKAACSSKAPVKPIQSKMGCPPMLPAKPVNPNKCDKSTMSKKDRCTTMTIKPNTSKQSCVPPNNKESSLSNELNDCDQTLVISISLGPKPVITITYDETVTVPLSIKDTMNDFNAEPKKCN